MARIEFDPACNVIVVDAEILDIDGEDVESLRMVLDTGSTFTIISWSVLSSLGYDPAVSRKRVKLIMGGGIVMAPVISVRQFRTLGESTNDIDVVCHDLPEEARVDGLVGMNFLRNFDIAINFSSGFVELKRLH